MDTSHDNFLLKDFVSFPGTPLSGLPHEHPRIQANAKNIMDTLQNTTLPEKLQALSGGLDRFMESYFSPIYGTKVPLSGFKLIHCAQGVIGLGIGGTSIYITDMNDPNDVGTVLDTEYVNRFRTPMLYFKTILPVGNDTFFVVVQSKYPRIAGPCLDRIHLVDLKNKKSITVPEDAGDKTQLIHYVEENGIHINGDKIRITGELVDDISTYLSQCNDRHDMAESRSIKGKSTYASCEIDKNTGEMKRVK